MFLARASVTDEADVEGRTAFMWAAGKGADQVISVFIKHNVDIQQVDKNGGSGMLQPLLLFSFKFTFIISPL